MASAFRIEKQRHVNDAQSAGDGHEGGEPDKAAEAEKHNQAVNRDRPGWCPDHHAERLKSPRS